MISQYISQEMILLVVAVVNGITALVTWRTNMHIKVAQADILRVEKATNSMKDALVISTGKEQHAAGKAEGIAIGEAQAIGKGEGIASVMSGALKPDAG